MESEILQKLQSLDSYSDAELAALLEEGRELIRGWRGRPGPLTRAAPALGAGPIPAVASPRARERVNYCGYALCARQPVRRPRGHAGGAGDSGCMRDRECSRCQCPQAG